MTHRFLAFLFAAALMTACAGFEPMNATTGAKAAYSDLNLVVNDGRDEGDREAGYLIRQHLADRISLDEDATYQLIITPRSQRIGLGLTAEDFASRFDSRVRANWKLIRIKDGSVIDQGRVERTATYSADRDPYQLISATNEAVERAAREVADRLLTDVALAISEKANGK